MRDVGSISDSIFTGKKGKLCSTKQQEVPITQLPDCYHYTSLTGVTFVSFLFFVPKMKIHNLLNFEEFSDI